MAATFFMMIYSLRKFFVKSRLLSLVGRYSLQIYLVHLYVYGFLAKVVPHGSELGRIDIGILLFILATIISLVIAVVIMKIPWLKRLVFPKGR